MVTLIPSSVVIVPFPFSDLSTTKLRPAIVLADARRGDWLLCQVTSNPFRDPDAVQLTQPSLKRGALDKTSYVRPAKMFTANESLIVKRVAILTDEAFAAVLSATIGVLASNLPEQTTEIEQNEDGVDDQ